MMILISITHYKPGYTYNYRHPDINNGHKHILAKYYKYSNNVEKYSIDGGLVSVSKKKYKKYLRLNYK